MRDLTRSLADRSRVPPNEVLSKAFRDFFSSRFESPGVITDFQTRLLIATWNHLKVQQNELEPEDWQAVFSVESLEKVLFVLSETKCPPECHESVQTIARFAFLELCASDELGPGGASEPAVIAYVNILSSNGNPEEAQRVVRQFWPSLREARPSPWLAVMKGFAMKGDRRRLRKVPGELEKYEGRFDPVSHGEITKILIEHDLLDAAKAMYECPLSDDLEPSLSTKEAVIKFAIRKSDLAWAQLVFESLPPSPNPETRNVTLLWEVVHGKGAAEIAEMLTTWVAEDPEVKSTLSISCVNNLIEYANSRENPQLAAEFAALASEWDLEPDTQTKLLHLESRIQAGDVKGALECSRNLLDLDQVALANLPLMNKLIKMLCYCEQRDSLFDQTSSLLDPLFENNVLLEPETVAALTHMLLYRHDYEAVSELLRPSLSSYDSEGRTKIRNALTGFITDPNQESNQAWEAYSLLRIAFPETGVSMRTNIMTSFFKRGSSEQACLVFGHMRQAEDFAHRPKPDTYARCFQGIARAGDAENLELVHNMLKLDLEVDLNTRIHNGLMLAYAACDMPEKSMAIFRQILQSDEGPSHKTITIFFKACEKHPNGAHEAMKMMKKVKLLEIDVDRRLYTSFLEALAAQCEFDRAAEAIDKMQSETGYVPTRNTIGFFYNAIPYQYWKDQVEQWAKEKYPEQWQQLEELKRTETEEGLVFDGITNEIVV